MFGEFPILKVIASIEIIPVFLSVFSGILRIISGKNKGRIIVAPKQLPVRPTTDMAKEALFNIIENRYYFDNKSVLDLFSGTGNIAYEFSSRGCPFVTAIDNHDACCRFITKMSNELNYTIEVQRMDTLDFLQKTNQKFDIIFADPPYDYTKYETMLNIIFSRNLIAEGGCLIVEHDGRFDSKNENFELRKYGKVHFSIFTI